MSVTSGFFNSLNHDRRYSAQQMSSIFDGVINDGVFANIGVAFKVTAVGGVTVNIGEGKAWFNSAWVYNDTVLPLTLEASEVVLDRIDAVVIDVDHNESVRSGTIKIVKGTPSSSPKRPTMASDKKHKQAPLVYIYRKAGSTEITQANITNMVGTSSCPYITGILQVQNIDNIVAQWNAQWNQWYAEKTAEADSDASELLAEMKSEFDIWFAYIQALLSEKIVEADSDTSELLAKMKSEFDIWFTDVQALLDDDVATALAAQVANLQGKFDDLAREGAVYDTIEDSDLDEILGSDGTPIQGKSMFTSNGNTNVSKPRDIGAVAVDGTTPMEGTLDMNTHRILNVAEPEVDTDAANAEYVKKVTSRTTAPRNLLDNSDFTNLVNQRGADSYTGASMSYDRWQTRRITIRATAEGLHVTPNNESGLRYLYQRVAQNLCGRKITIAIDGMPAGGFIKIFNLATTVQAASSEELSEGLNVYTAEIPVGFENGISVLFYIPDNSEATLKWAALYEGEYTIDTLPEYQPKGYAAEMVACRRYFRKKINTLVPGFVVANLNGIVLSIESDEPFYKNPTLKIDTITWIRGGGKNITTIPAWTISVYSNNNVSPVFSVNFETAIDQTSYASVYVYCTYTLSADL